MDDAIITSRQIFSLLTVSAGKAIIAILSVLTAIIASRVYGQVGLGVFALLRVAPAVFMVLTDPGFSHAIPYLSANRKIGTPTLILNSVVVYALISIFQIALWLAIAPLIQKHLLPQLSLSALYWAALLCPMQSITILVINVLRARHKYNLANNVFLVAEAVLLAAMVGVFYLSSETIDNLVAILIFSSAISILAGVVFTCFVVERESPRFDMAVIREGIVFGIKSQAGNAFQILNYRLDHLLLGLFLSAEKVAIYFVATKSIEFFRFFTASIVFVFEPVFASQAVLDARSHVRRMLKPLLLANFTLLAIGIIIAPYFYPILFGGWSEQATAPLLVLAIGFTISGANSLFGAYYLGQGRPIVPTLASSAGLVVTVGFGVVLIPFFGVIGAAVTSSVTYAVVTMVYAYVFVKKEPVVR